MTIGQVIDANTVLKQKVETLQSAVASQGGATLGSFTVASKAALRALVVKEMSGGKGFPVAAFINPVSITSHDTGTRIVSDPELTSELKALERAGMTRPMDRRFISGFSRRTTPACHNGTTMAVGEQISSLSSKSA